MQSYIKIKAGNYRGTKCDGMIFPLVSQFKMGAKGGAVTVMNNGAFPGYPEQIKIKVAKPSSYDFVTEHDYAAQGSTPVAAAAAEAESVSNETDEQVMERIGERFEILEDMTKAAINGDIRAMIVTGPPGVGKSYGVETQMEKASMFDKIAGRKLKYNVVKGGISDIGLYVVLNKHADPKNVIVFDDCDDVFRDEGSLNLLKAALDSGKKGRKISWHKESNTLRREGMPNEFFFHGSIVFITNMTFETARGNMKSHLEALQSRCHFLDLSLDTMREKLLRIKQIVATGELFRDYSFTPEQEQEVVDFMFENKNKLREISLRMVLKIADLVALGSNWKRTAAVTCMKAV
jgi:hypothetical protein